jgi:hypothetical protein
MRKTKMSWLVIGFFSLLSGCDEKKTKVESGESQTKETKSVGALIISKAIKEDMPPTHPDFGLKEIPVAPKKVDVPVHIAEVNLDIQKIIAASADPARKIWDKYYQISLAQREANEIVQKETLWDQLAEKLGGEKLPTLFYHEGKEENMDLIKGLYGLYLASFVASSKGGGELFDFIEERAGDNATKQIDIDLFKIVVSGMLDAEGRLDGMTFKRWKKLSDSPNPVYKMLAVQVGDRLFEEGGVSDENLNQSRLNYYQSFLKDDSQKIRIEALKGIRNLGDELAIPVLDSYLKSEYGKTDQIEAERVFGR